MSTVFWIMLETDTEDFPYDDLGVLFKELDTLDQRCGQLQVKPLSEFVDYSDVEFNLSDEDLDENWLKEHARYVSPTELLVTLRVLEHASNQSEDDEEMQQEIHYVMNRCLEAEKQNIRVRLLAVM